MVQGVTSLTNGFSDAIGLNTENVCINAFHWFQKERKVAGFQTYVSKIDVVAEISEKNFEKTI